MASAGAFLFPMKISSIVCSGTKSPAGTASSSSGPISIPIPARRLAVSTDNQTKPKEFFSGNGKFGNTEEADTSSFEDGKRPYSEFDELEKERRESVKDYLEQAKDLIRSDGGPPRWFSPLECGSRLNDSPLLLFLPGYYSLISRKTFIDYYGAFLFMA